MFCDFMIHGVSMRNNVWDYNNGWNIDPENWGMKDRALDIWKDIKQSVCLTTSAAVATALVGAVVLTYAPLIGITAIVASLAIAAFSFYRNTQANEQVRLWNKLEKRSSPHPEGLDSKVPEFSYESNLTPKQAAILRECIDYKLPENNTNDPQVGIDAFFQTHPLNRFSNADAPDALFPFYRIYSSLKNHYESFKNDKIKSTIDCEGLRSRNAGECASNHNKQLLQKINHAQELATLDEASERQKANGKIGTEDSIKYEVKKAVYEYSLNYVNEAFKQVIQKIKEQFVDETKRIEKSAENYLTALETTLFNFTEALQNQRKDSIVEDELPVFKHETKKYPEYDLQLAAIPYDPSCKASKEDFEKIMARFK